MFKGRLLGNEIHFPPFSCPAPNASPGDGAIPSVSVNDLLGSFPRRLFLLHKGREEFIAPNVEWPWIGMNKSTLQGVPLTFRYLIKWSYHLQTYLLRDVYIPRETPLQSGLDRDEQSILHTDSVSVSYYIIQNRVSVYQPLRSWRFINICSKSLIFTNILSPSLPFLFLYPPIKQHAIFLTNLLTYILSLFINLSS